MVAFNGVHDLYDDFCAYCRVRIGTRKTLVLYSYSCSVGVVTWNGLIYVSGLGSFIGVICFLSVMRISGLIHQGMILQ